MNRRRPGRPGITDEQARNVRAVLRRVSEERFDGNASAFARALGLSSSAISQMISEKNRPSFDTVLLLAKLLDVQPEQVLSDALPPATPDRYPERAKALARLRGILPPEVVEHIQDSTIHGPAFSEAEWIRYAMDELDRHVRTTALRARVVPEARKQ